MQAGATRVKLKNRFASGFAMGSLFPFLCVELFPFLWEKFFFARLRPAPG